MVVGAPRTFADVPGPAVALAPAHAPAAAPPAKLAAGSEVPPRPGPLQPPGGSADPTAFRATEVVALAQLVLSRNFHGPVRTATAQELLYQARMALAKGESSLASDLANLASRIMAPQGFDGTGRHLGLRPEEAIAQPMQSGGGARADSDALAAPGPPATPGLAQPAAPPAALALAPIPGLAPLALRERGVVLQGPPSRPRPQTARLATDGTPRGIPRT